MDFDRRTVSATWTRLVVEALEDYGLDVDELCAEAGVRLDDLKKTSFRSSADSLTRLWVEALNASNDPAIGLVMSSRPLLLQFNSMIYSFIRRRALQA